MSRFDSKIGVRRDEVGALLNDIELRLAPLEDVVRTEGEGQGTDLPTVDASFLPVYDRSDKRGVYVTLRFDIPDNTYDLKIVLVERALAVDEASYDQKRIKTDLANDIEDDHRAVQKVTDRLDKRLKYSTQYDIIRLVAIDQEGRPIPNPANTDFTGYPGNILFTFTTPERFGSPPFPALADIDTQLDPETEGYDAYAIVTNVCPLHPESGAIQTYRQAGVDWIQNILTRDFGGVTGVQKIPERHLLDDAELDAAIVGGPNAGRGTAKVKFIGLIPGASYTLAQVTVHTVDGKRTTTGSVAFIAGSLSRSLGSLLNVALVFSSTDPFDDGQWIDVALEFTQPWPAPVSLRNVTQDYKRSTVTNWKNRLTKDSRPQSDSYHRQVNAGTVNITIGTTTLNGAGTQMTRWEAGWKIIVGAQTFTIAIKPTSDTSAQVTVAATATVIPSAYVVVMVMPLRSIKVKPNRTYNNEVRLVARGNTSLVITGNVVVGADGHIAVDTLPPANLNTPRLGFKRGKLHQKMPMSGVTEINTLNTVEMQIGTGFVSLNIDDLESDAAVAGTVFYQVGHDDCNIVLPMSLKQLRRIFGDVQLTGRFRLTNNIGQTTSPVSNVLGTLSGQTDYSPNSGGGGELWNGDFTNDDGFTATTLGNWEQYRITNGNFLIIDTGTTRGRWDRDNHLVFWRQNDNSTNKVYIYQSFFRSLVFGDFKSWSFFVSSNGVLTADLDVFIGAIIEPLTDVWTIAANLHTVTADTASGLALSELRAGAEVSINNEIRTVVSITNDDTFEVTPNFSGVAAGQSVHAVVPVSEIVSLGSRLYFSIETYIEATVQIDPAAAANFDTEDLYILFRTSTTIGTGGPYLQLSRVMQVTGRTPVQFDRRAIREQNVTTTGTDPASGAPIAAENLGFVPTGGIAGDRQDRSGALGDVPESGEAMIVP